MQQKKSISALTIGLDALLKKNRASLTDDEIELLREIKALLLEIDEQKTKEERESVALKIIVLFLRFFQHPIAWELVEKMVHQMKDII